MIPESTIREIADRIDIVEVIGEYVSLKRSGANWVGLCPFHAEKSPSFNVNPARSIFHCFGCGVGGNVFSFIMRHHGVTFPEAVRMLGKRVGIRVDEEDETPNGRRQREERDESRRIMGLATAYFRRMLTGHPDAGRAQNYLRQRGVDGPTTEAYLLGFAPDERDGLVRHLTRHQVFLPLAERLGLIRQGGGNFVDLFRNRLIFPIRDLTGETVAFAGRILGEGNPKYLNSPESPLYRKSSVLFGLHAAKQAGRDSGIIVVEGYFDQLALTMAGFPNVVATCGTALTDGHIALLRRFTRTVYLMFDGDAAGQKGAERTLDLILPQGVTGQVVLLPPGEDPDTFVSRFGHDAVQDLVDSAPELFDWYVRRLSQTIDLSTVGGTMALVDALTPKLRLIGDPLARDLRISEICRRYSLNELLFKRRFRGGASPSPPSASQEAPRGDADPELMMIVLMGRSPEILAAAVQDRVVEELSPPVRDAAGRLVAEASSGRSVDWETIVETVTSADLQVSLRRLLVSDDLFTDADLQRMYADLVQTIRRRRLKRSADLRIELVRADPGSKRYREILMELETLRNCKSGLL